MSANKALSTKKVTAPNHCLQPDRGPLAVLKNPQGREWAARGVRKR